MKKLHKAKSEWRRKWHIVYNDPYDNSALPVSFTFLIVEETTYRYDEHALTHSQSLVLLLGIMKFRDRIPKLLRNGMVLWI